MLRVRPLRRNLSLRVAQLPFGRERSAGLQGALPTSTSSRRELRSFARRRGSRGPGYPNLVYFTATGPTLIVGPNQLTYKSTDGGRTFVRVSDTFPAEAGGPCLRAGYPQAGVSSPRTEPFIDPGRARLSTSCPRSPSARCASASCEARTRGRAGSTSRFRAAALRCSSPPSRSTPRTRSIWRGPTARPVGSSRPRRRTAR